MLLCSDSVWFESVHLKLHKKSIIELHSMIIDLLLVERHTICLSYFVSNMHCDSYQW